MQYDQCLTKGPDGSKIMITHCNLNEYKDWQYFKVCNRRIGEKQLSFTSCFITPFLLLLCTYHKIEIYDKIN